MLWLTAVAAPARTMASAADVRGYYSIMEKLPAKVLLDKGKVLSGQKDMPDSALVCYSIVANKYHKSSNKEALDLLMSAYHGQWYVYLFHYNDYVKAKESLVNYLKVCEKAKKNKSRAFLMFGAMYETMANNTDENTLANDAIRYYRLAIQEAKIENDHNVIVNAFTNLVELSSDIQEIRKLANEYAVFNTVRNDTTLNYIYHFGEDTYKCSLSMAEGNYAEALRYCSRLIDNTPKDIGHTRYLLFALMKRSRIYAKTNKLEKAIDDIKHIEQICVENDLKDGKILAYAELCKYYGSIGDKSLQSEYNLKHLALKDSVTNYRQMASVREMAFLNEMKAVEEQIEEMEQSRKYWAWAAMVLCVIAIVVGMFLVILRRKNVRLRQSNEALYERNLEMLHQDEARRKEKTEKYKGSSLDDQTKENILEVLRSVMESSDEVFSSDFTIDCLAELSGQKSKMVSQVINELCGTNFNTFVNEYRIKEACKRMNDHEATANLTIEAIGNGVGFKSRNSFISAFKKFTGLTPSEYQIIAKTHQK